VRVLGANNQASDREIQTGLKDSMNTEVKSGLNEGEKVVMSEMGAAEKAEAVGRGEGGAKNGPFWAGGRGLSR